MSVRVRVGKYELGRTLGEGVFSKVKYGRNRETGAPVAIKIIDKEYILKHKLSNLIKREILTMKRIKHPHVVQLLEVLASKRKVYLVMEYVNGGELFDRIVGVGRLEEDEVRRYFQQLIQAVDYCHSRGVYHRDLKPENLLLDSKGNLKISDFGLSALSQQESQKDGLLHTICGTPNYVAPEVINEKGYDGVPADLWSCGVILYVLYAGFLPFEDSNLMRLYKKIDQAAFTCPSWFSEGAKALVKRILDPNPKKRMTIPEIVEDEWFKVGYNPLEYVEIDNAVGDFDAIVDDPEDSPVIEESKPMLVNAFELISMSQGLNLSGLFEEQETLVKTESRFTIKHPVKDIISRIEGFANSSGFTVKKKNYKMNIQSMKPGRKGCLSVATEIFEMAPSLFMVEVKKSSGDTLEYKDFHKSLLTGLKDVVWKTE